MSKAVLGPATTQRCRSRGPVAAKLVVDQWLLERPPAPDLESYLVCTWQGDLGAMRLPLPDECLDLVWVDDGSIWLSGPETRSWPRGYPLGTEAVGVRFKPGLGSAVLGLAASEVRDTRIRIDELWRDRKARDLAERLADQPSGRRRALAVEGAVRRLVEAARPVDEVALEVADCLSRTGPASVRDLSRVVGLSERQIHRRCTAAFGYGPAVLVRILRLHRVLELARAHDRMPGLADLAARAGYFDQQHLCHDVRAIVGTTPGTLLAAPGVRSMQDVSTGPIEDVQSGSSRQVRTDLMTLPDIVTQDAWHAAAKALVVREKEVTKLRDELNTQRRQLPMVEVTNDYVFEGGSGCARDVYGKASLRDMFDGRRQLIVDHYMFDPSWEDGCPSCAGRVDQYGNLEHLHDRDTTIAVVSRAPLSKIEPFKQRMGWTFPWYSSFGSNFNYDFHVTLDESVAPIEYNYRDQAELEEAGFSDMTGELHGTSVFLRDGDRVFHTYSTYGRGTEQVGGTHYYLDMTALGRQEDWEEPKDRSSARHPAAGQA